MFKNIALLGISTLACVAILELGIRVALPINATAFRNDAAEFRPGVGMLKKPHQVATNVQPCLEIKEIRFNSTGFRDNELPPGAGPSVGILGDSFMEAVQVPEGEYTAAVMERILSRPVLNLAIGGANTAKQLRIYRLLLAPHRPKVVLLFVTLGNDVLDNNCVTKQKEAAALGAPEFTGICGTLSGGRVTYQEPVSVSGTGASAPRPSSVPSESWMAKLKSNCRTCVILNDVSKRFGISLSSTAQSEPDAYEAGLNLYRPVEALEASAATAWRDAWRITELMLLELRDAVTHDGGRLIIVPVPDAIRVSPAWREEFKALYAFAPKADVDPQRPLRSLSEIAARNNLTMFDLDSVFLAYRDRFDLPYPYFGFACDGHWNPLGHFLAASWISEQLVLQGHIDMPGAREFVRARQHERQRSPKEILGDEAYASIYRRGIFRLRSAVYGLPIQD